LRGHSRLFFFVLIAAELFNRFCSNSRTKNFQKKTFKNTFGFSSLILNNLSPRSRSNYVLVPFVSIEVPFRIMGRVVKQFQILHTEHALPLGERSY
jgi:hypothetical protein